MSDWQLEGYGFRVMFLKVGSQGFIVFAAHCYRFLFFIAMLTLCPSVLLKSGFSPVRMRCDDGTCLPDPKQKRLLHFICLAGGSLCCGLAFSSRGMTAAGDAALNKLIAAIDEVRGGSQRVLIVTAGFFLHRSAYHCIHLKYPLPLAARHQRRTGHHMRNVSLRPTRYRRPSCASET
jgi:hypothetical protein